MTSFLEINTSSRANVEESFFSIANRLMNDFQLVVNEHRYRLLDIEFYYYAPGIFEDVYAHRHEAQLQMGKWYFHGSGIDITFGNGECHGGILIRAIGKLTGEGYGDRNGIYKEIHGPLKVKTELFSNMGNAFNKRASYIYLEDVSMDRMGANMRFLDYIIKTSRINLNSTNDCESKRFCNGKYRFVTFPYLKLKDKTKIAHDMLEQYPDLGKNGVNKALGSVFLK